ncbi:MAG: YihY/virulence factor BrkB family protein [Ruminococcaceae bacterium]|nr:YihY/virulence factor BrkB family protein [Oscillospiraceae bacterium]
MHKLKKVLNSAIYAIERISKRFDSDNLSAYAAQAAFFIFISIFPFLMLFLNLLKYIPFFSSESIEVWTMEVFSPIIGELLKGIIQEANSSGSGALISITTIAALWACSKGVLGIIYGLNSIYKTPEKRGYILLRATAVFYTVGLLVALIVVLLLMVFGNMILNLVLTHIPALDSFANAVRIVRWLVSFGFLTIFFMFLYTVIPERKTKFKNEIPGAVISAIGWVGFSALYSLYMDMFASRSNIYGSLAAIIFFLLWIYICMIILFVGAEINDILRVHDFSVIIRRRRDMKKIGRVQAQIRSKDNGGSDKKQ